MTDPYRTPSSMESQTLADDKSFISASLAAIGLFLLLQKKQLKKAF